MFAICILATCVKENRVIVVQKYCKHKQIIYNITLKATVQLKYNVLRQNNIKVIIIYAFYKTLLICLKKKMLNIR